MLESRTEPFWSQRMQVLVGKLSALPPSLPVHMELASMASPQLIRDIVTRVGDSGVS